MSDRNGLISGLITPFADEATAQSRRPPHAQRQSRAGYGASLLSLCYATREVYGPLARWPVEPAFHYAWWGCAVLGGWWLLAGLFGRIRGPLVGGLGLFVEAAGASGLLWKHIYPLGMPLATFLLHAAYLAVLWSALAQLATALIGPPRGNARKLVDENIAENEFDWDRV
jgi:hypothetical protein